MNIFKAMVPDLVCASLETLPYEDLKARGINCLLLDFDNTLGPDRALAPDEYSFRCLEKIKELEFSCCLVSNAKSQRSAGIAKDLGIPCVTYARKPKPDGVKEAMALMGKEEGECAMVGDQVFTDVMAGRLAGIYTVMVEKYQSHEIWYVAIKRPFERIVRLIAGF